MLKNKKDIVFLAQNGLLQIRNTVVKMTSADVENGVFSLKTQDSRVYTIIRRSDCYNQYFMYEGDDLDKILEYICSGNRCVAHGYTLDECILKVPSIQIKAYFAWKWVNDDRASKFLYKIYQRFTCSDKEKKIECLRKHLRYDSLENVLFGIYQEEVFGTKNEIFDF